MWTWGLLEVSPWKIEILCPDDGAEAESESKNSPRQCSIRLSQKGPTTHVLIHLLNVLFTIAGSGSRGAERAHLICLSEEQQQVCWRPVLFIQCRCCCGPGAYTKQMDTFKVMTTRNDFTTTESCPFDFLLTDLRIVRPSADLHFVVGFVLHCVENYFTLSFLFFTLELSIEARMQGFKWSSSSAGTMGLLGPCHDNWPAEVQQALFWGLHYPIYPDFPICKTSIQALFFFLTSRDF